MSSNPKTSSSDSAPVALYGHCESVYKAMLEEAKTVYIAENDTTMVVWEGMLVHLITGKLFLSTPYFTSITKALKRMGCIRQLKRGGGTAPSQWELLKAPSLDAFEHDLPVRELVQGKYAALQEQMTLLTNRVGKLEEIFGKFFNDELEASKGVENDNT